jgi:hypothetical protein
MLSFDEFIFASFDKSSILSPIKEHPRIFYLSEEDLKNFGYKRVCCPFFVYYPLLLLLKKIAILIFACRIHSD